MSDALTIRVLGTPAPQGSKKGFYNEKLGRVQIVDDNKPAVRTWRADVKDAAVAAAAEAGWETATGPLWISVTYWFMRPKYHFGTGRNFAVLKDTAPVWHDKKPDRDKLDRATNDALVAAGIMRDDCLNAAGPSEKRYVVPGQLPGATIEVHRLDVSVGEVPSAGASSVQESLL